LSPSAAAIVNTLKLAPVSAPARRLGGGIGRRGVHKIWPSAFGVDEDKLNALEKKWSQRRPEILD